MKWKIILALIVLMLFIVGCGKKAVEDVGEETTEDTGGVEEETDISDDISEVDTLEEDLDLAELENLEKELDEIDWEE